MRAVLKPFVFALLGLAALSAPAFAEGAYVRTDQLDFITLLPPPPAQGSEGDKADIAAVIAAQEKRKPESAARAIADKEISVFRFADVIGPEFSAEKLPTVAAFFEKVKSDAHLPVEAVKKYWNRPRPEAADAAIKPVLPLPRNAAYPSGHTTWARLNAIVLAAMLPEKREAIFARADEYADNRIVAGVHYPTDIAAGKVAGSLLAAAERENPAFGPDFEAAKAELRASLKLAATQ